MCVEMSFIYKTCGNRGTNELASIVDMALRDVNSPRRTCLLGVGLAGSKREL